MVASIEQEEEFILNLGKALTKWQWVEGAVYDLFRAFMKGANPKLISLIFHHIQSFESQIQLLSKCAYFTLPKGKLADRWDKKKAIGTLRKRLIKQMEMRNRLVHFKYHTGGGEGVTPVSLGPSFMDATYAINDRWKNPDLEIDLRRLKRAQYEFRKLAGDLRQFRDDFETISK